MASGKCLHEWCRVTCSSYPSVEIRNMSSSFKDGLAFCAIIHKHRPDLIDFNSLSKDNAYQNNKLAFEVAETKLGIPALLDPKDMVSTKGPDCLSVITYLSQYYYFFNRKSCGPSRSWSLHITVLNNITKSNKSPDGPKSLKSPTDLEARTEGRFANTRSQTPCNLCFKPVHLIQRHLIDGKVYHRSCFRCKVCHCTLLPGSFTQGSDTGSLICACHVADSKSLNADVNQEVESTDNQPKCRFQAGLSSPGELTVTSVSHYTKKLESQDRLVSKTLQKHAVKEQEGSREEEDKGNSCVGSHHPPQPTVKEKTFDGAKKNKLLPTHADSKEQQPPCAQVTERSTRPVPAPRRSMDAYVVPVPAPRTRTVPTMTSSPGGSGTQSPSGSSQITSPKVMTNHPWMTIVHSGPWTQLPPAPAPIPLPRSKSVPNAQGLWRRRKIPPPNPFEEDEELEDTGGEAVKPESEAAVNSEDSRDVHAVVCSSVAHNPAREPEQNEGKPLVKTDVKEDAGEGTPDRAKGVTAVTDAEKASAEQAGGVHQTEASDETEEVADLHTASAQSHKLPRSLSVPAITSEHSPTHSESNESITSCQGTPTSKENPFNRKSEMSKSKTLQDISSSRGPAPGHGFPLIKRKVQTDQGFSVENLQAEMRELHQHLETLEQRGVQLEKSLREGTSSKDEEEILTEWFSLNHERQILSRKDSELVSLTKQQKLDDRQADVEYELRCLLNKPESDWSREDREREQQLMVELVAVIEQRNQIISSLDQDRQREREEDMLWESMVKNKDFQKERLKDLKKSKGKFKPAKVFKLLNYKTESSKDKQKKN
ncbi:MICAL-like protein 1 isoform X2 [Cololabis saira]|uniref:MICAL-like protein 1 isoform X2 n=1 Tax=Cololabis saira TaxID=129043 RepID=UPI002AD58D75|nr:MICAL-like protein 1 isoform X2 [Cololabis saira]